jgi:cation diffusion facilitator family transporter
VSTGRHDHTPHAPHSHGPGTGPGNADDRYDHRYGGHDGHGHPTGHGNEQHTHRHGLAGFVGRVLRPHSHDAAGSVDSALEASAQGVRAVKVSLVALGVTAALQLLVVLYTGSVALLADTIHNFSDALTAVPLWVAFVLGRRTASRRYTYGYGRAEDLAGVFIVAMIAGSALLAGYESVRRLLDPQPLTHLGVVIAAGIVGFVGNELVAVYRIRVGRRIGSAALVADGLHARTDGLTSLAVVAGALGLLAGYPLADPLVGIAITVAILVVLRGAGTEIGRRLMDAVDPALLETAEAALRTVEGVRDVEALRLRWIGHRMRAEAAVLVDPAITVIDGHQIAVAAHHQLLHDVPRLSGATVHVSPAGDHGDQQHQRLAHHR